VSSAESQVTQGIDLSGLVGAMVESYQSLARLKHIDAGHLPSRDKVIELIRELRHLIYPGFFGRQNLKTHELEKHVGEMLKDVHDRLYDQVRSAIRHHQQRTGDNTCADCDVTAAAVTAEFMGRLPELRRVLATDVEAAFDGDPAAGSTDEIIFSYPGFFAITVYRIAHELHVQKVPLIPRIMTEYAHNLTGIDIHPGATIDEFFFIDHGTGVVIGETCLIGKHVKIYQGVTLGATSTRDVEQLRGAKRHPTIEDEVTIYPNASVLGGGTVIGRGATVNGNVFITQSVPPHTRVSVKHPEIIYRNRPPREFTQDYSVGRT